VFILAISVARVLEEALPFTMHQFPREEYSFLFMLVEKNVINLYTLDSKSDFSDVGGLTRD
jgi:hypothetical protein